MLPDVNFSGDIQYRGLFLDSAFWLMSPFCVIDGAKQVEPSVGVASDMPSSKDARSSAKTSCGFVHTSNCSALLNTAAAGGKLPNVPPCREHMRKSLPAELLCVRKLSFPGWMLMLLEMLFPLSMKAGGCSKKHLQASAHINVACHLVFLTVLRNIQMNTDKLCRCLGISN